MKEYMIDSKSEFARMLDVEIHAYSKWEIGATPVLETALKVAGKLNKKIEDIWHLE